MMNTGMEVYPVKTGGGYYSICGLIKETILHKSTKRMARQGPSLRCCFILIP